MEALAPHSTGLWKGQTYTWAQEKAASWGHFATQDGVELGGCCRAMALPAFCILVGTWRGADGHHQFPPDRVMGSGGCSWC